MKKIMKGKRKKKRKGKRKAKGRGGEERQKEKEKRRKELPKSFWESPLNHYTVLSFSLWLSLPYILGLFPWTANFSKAGLILPNLCNVLIFNRV